MDKIIENHLADYALRIANAYALGQVSRARALERELAEYKRTPAVSIYLNTK